METTGSSSSGWRSQDEAAPRSGLALDTDVGMPRRGPRQIAPTGEEMARDRIEASERYARTRSTIRPVQKERGGIAWLPKALSATIVVIALMAAASAFLK